MNAVSEITVPAVMRVMPENITPLWSQIEHLLLPVLALTSTHTAEDVRRSLMSMQAQLWARIEGGEVKAVVTTEFVNYPVGLFVRVWHAGALTGAMDDDAFFDVLDRWRQANGCVGFEAVGRHGWLRRFPEARVEGLVMRWVP